MMISMLHIFGPIISNLQLIIEHGGYFILFIITILEGIPAIGSLVPGHTVVMMSGFLSKLYIFNINMVIPIVIIGAMIGDYTGYFLGKKYGYNFLKKLGKIFFIKDEYIEKTKAIIAKHTGKSIILGRFNPITRPLVPFIIGASHVHQNKFWFYDFIGVFIWSIGSIGIGYIFGASYHIIAGIFGKFILIALIGAAFIIYSYNFINRKFHIFAKYELFVVSLNIIGLYAFFKTIQDALASKAFMANLDIWINMFFTAHDNMTFILLMTIITDIFSPTVLSILAFIGVIYFIIKKNWTYVFITVFSMGGGLFLNAFIKEIVERARPINALIIENDFSFPSGHTIAATIFFTLLIYFFARKIKHIVWRELFISISVFCVILTGISRLYLGVHWLSDTVAGVSLGIFWTTLMILLIRYIEIIINSIRGRKEL